MGIAPYKTFTFDGESSADYGVYITGTGVFNAPKRSVEMVEIAGRNGSFALDKGKFENIEVTYKVGIVDDSEADFADRVSDFRNWLCSKVGYCRLEDEYNPNEYRMGVYSSGVEIDHDLLIAGEAEITFNCKPQRWLTSGETKTTLVSGNDITNPTLFPSKPQLQTYGYGTIDIGGQEIEVNNIEVGEVQISAYNDSALTVTINDGLLNAGDVFSVSGEAFTFYYYGKNSRKVTDVTRTSVTNCTAIDYNVGTLRRGQKMWLPDITFIKGTSSSQTSTCSCSVSVLYNGSTTSTSVTISVTMSYDGANKVKYTSSASTTISNVPRYSSATTPDIYGFSSKSALGTPTYIDLDIGECYNLDSGSAVSVNNAVLFPAGLPTLPSGDTTITFDNTFTKVEIVPRWWKV